MRTARLGGVASRTHLLARNNQQLAALSTRAVGRSIPSPSRPSLLSKARSAQCPAPTSIRLQSTVAELPAPAPKKKRFRFLRWTGRTIVLATVGALGYLVYAIYEDRYPLEQAPADPNKKTLVILGKSFILEVQAQLSIRLTLDFRYWLGIGNPS